MAWATFTFASHGQTNMNIVFIGWCHQPTRNHDKVWGLVDKGNGEYMTFWGRRGNNFQTNMKAMNDQQRRQLVHSKIMKGYRRIPSDEWDTIYDHFGRDVFKLMLKGG